MQRLMNRTPVAQETDQELASGITLYIKLKSYSKAKETIARIKRCLENGSLC